MRLEVHGVSKTFGATRACHKVYLQAGAGEAHALLGGEGAGKSTLLKMLGGLERPDSGTLYLDGVPYAPRTPKEARDAGVSIVLQEPALAPDLTVEENLLLGLEPSLGGWRRGWIDRARLKERALRMLAAFPRGAIPPGVPAGSLPFARQRQVEIARALITEPRLLLLDEPAHGLSRRDTAGLFTLLRERAARGTTILYAPRLPEEAYTLCTHYTFLRGGESVSAGLVADLDRAAVRRTMTGFEPPEIDPRLSRYRGKVVLEAKGLSGATVRGVHLALRAGEVYGLAGLPGAGAGELLRLLFGLEPVTGGEIRLDGRRATRASPRSRLRAGVGLASDARRGEDLILGGSIADNLTLTHLADFGSLGFFSGERRSMSALDWMAKLHIRARGPSQPVSRLSGGDRRKVALGRLMQHHARILLLNEPAGGIEPREKMEIYELIGTLAEGGAAILWVSSCLPELLGLCDTVGVMRGGRLVAVRPARDWTQAEAAAVAAPEERE